MACEIAEYKRIVLVVWGKPEIADFKRIVDAVEPICKARGPVLLIARIPVGAEAPDQATRSRISSMMPDLMRSCASFHAVLEGTGFVNAAKRAALTTIFMMTGRRMPYHVHARVEDVQQGLAPALVGEFLVAVERFRPRGLLARNLASLFPPAHTAA
jgi:hypothetical protein